VRPLRALLPALVAGGAALAAVGLASELRLRRDLPATDAWRRIPVEPRGATRLGISFRPVQAEAMGLDAPEALATLLAYPYELIRLGAYWSRIEPRAGCWDTGELDRQVEAAERAGKQIVLGVGPIKNFGYPEFFVPPHHLGTPLREGSLIGPERHAGLLAAGVDFVGRIVDRYRDRESIVAWQVEHDAVEPLGMEHSWRLATDLVEREVEAVRGADPSRPILLNGFLPTSLAVGASQWWRTRGQGDALALALRMADVVGVDFYPRHALARVGGRTLYLDGSRAPWQAFQRRRLFAPERLRGRRLVVTEGQAEPWETVTAPPAPAGRHLYSCPPEQIIATFNHCLAWAREAGAALDAYLFWGAEYWLLRRRGGDPEYLAAFARVVEEA
jgi:hypothetical protein